MAPINEWGFVSELGRGLTFQYLNELGQLKLLSRLVRLGQCLSPEEYKALLFIYDRTYGWRRSEAVISDSQFLVGVVFDGGLDAAPIGLTPVARALQGADDVEEVGIVALLLRRHAPGEALKSVAAATFAQGKAGGPCLVGEGRIAMMRLTSDGV
jgi:hypothetical protein